MTSVLTHSHPHAASTPGLIRVARLACGILALATAAALAWSIAAGPRGLSGVGYVAFLALQVATAVLLGFLAAHRFRPDHTAAFAATALAAAVVDAVTQGTLILMTDTAPRGLTAVRVLALASSIAAAVVFALLRDRPATHAVLLQLAHRAIALAVWLLIGKLILTLWGRPLAWVAHLLPATAALLAAAALAALTVRSTSRDEPLAASFAEARHLTRASGILLAATLVWLSWAAVFAAP